MISLVLGWIGLGLPRPPLLMPIGLRVVLFPPRAWFWGRGIARFRVVRLGGPKVREARSNVADVQDAGDVFMYRDSSIAPLLDLRRRITAVMDVLDSMIRSGGSLARSVELTIQWDFNLRTGPVYPVTLDDLNLVRDGGIGEFRCVVGDLHCRLTVFVHEVVGHFFKTRMKQMRH